MMEQNRDTYPKQPKLVIVIALVSRLLAKFQWLLFLYPWRLYFSFDFQASQTKNYWDNQEAHCLHFLMALNVSWHLLPYICPKITQNNHKHCNIPL